MTRSHSRVGEVSSPCPFLPLSGWESSRGKIGIKKLLYNTGRLLHSFVHTTLDHRRGGQIVSRNWKELLSLVKDIQPNINISVGTHKIRRDQPGQIIEVLYNLVRHSHAFTKAYASAIAHNAQRYVVKCRLVLNKHKRRGNSPCEFVLQPLTVPNGKIKSTADLQDQTEAKSQPLLHPGVDRQSKSLVLNT